MSNLGEMLARLKQGPFPQDFNPELGGSYDQFNKMHDRLKRVLKATKEQVAKETKKLYVASKSRPAVKDKTKMPKRKLKNFKGSTLEEYNAFLHNRAVEHNKSLEDESDRYLQYIEGKISSWRKTGKRPSVPVVKKMVELVALEDKASEKKPVRKTKIVKKIVKNE